MAEKNELQKTISFRLNIKREDERALYEMIMSHNHGGADDPYGSGGAYIKAALKNFYVNESQVRQQETCSSQIKDLLNESLSLQKEFIRNNLEVYHDRLIKEISESIANALADSTVLLSNNREDSIRDTLVMGNTIKDEICKPIIEAEETMPEEALSYLQNL